MTQKMITIDGNEAAARVAHRINEVIAIYPITPSSPMGEWADQYSAEGKTNIWGSVPLVVEMQAEGGAAGAVHGTRAAASPLAVFRRRWEKAGLGKQPQRLGRWESVTSSYRYCSHPVKLDKSSLTTPSLRV